MPSLSTNAFVELLQNIDTQIKQSQEYDLANNREMAYMALWVALEFSIKRVYCLHKELSKAPISLPREKEFLACLNYFHLEGCLLWDFMASKKKDRIRRNEIAHSATPFGSEKTYREYVNEAHRVIGVFRTCLERQFSALESNT